MTTNALTIQDEMSLPANVEDFLADKKALALATGQEEEMPIGLPMLKIQFQPEWIDPDDAENVITLPRGHYTTTFNPEGGTSRVTAFAKEITLRPFFRGYRYSEYDAEENVYKRETNIFTSWQAVVIDNLGNETKGKYGKKFGKASGNPENEEVKCQNIVFGLVTFKDAKDMNGASVEVVDLPVMFAPQGANFVPFGDAITEATKGGVPFIQRAFDMKTKREVNGAVTYFVSQYKSKPSDFNSEDFKQLGEFLEVVKGINEKVSAEHLKARKDGSAEDIVGKVTGMSDSQAAGEFDDDIPF